MMRAKGKATFLDAMKETTSPVSPAAAAKEALKEDEWEVRPGGMLVQKRDPGSDAPAGAPVPTIRLKVKFNAVSHEIYISSQASFGEVKKMMSEKTGLHHEDQKVLYKGKEMDSKAFLDMSGVKDRSKLALLEDPDAQAKRLIEQRRADKAHRASKSVSRISLDVDKLATKVSALEAIVRKGGKVVEADVVALTEALMTELVKLDAIAADGEVKAQRRLQEKRVQKYVETLDVIRAKNAAAPKANGTGNGQAKGDRSLHLPPRPPPVSQRRQFKQQPAPATGKAAAAPPTASWETFDLLSSMPSTSSATATTTMAAATTTTKPASNNNSTSPIPRFDWELF
ncbi:BAG family molecular chaperone regulator 3-like [Triticum dicoccoides]|nr:BAG family molecular chaperone regulator 3-like [Triticum dicoccoides]